MCYGHTSPGEVCPPHGGVYNDIYGDGLSAAAASFRKCYGHMELGSAPLMWSRGKSPVGLGDFIHGS